jgi:hypothetical protein
MFSFLVVERRYDEERRRQSYQSSLEKQKAGYLPNTLEPAPIGSRE